MSLKGLVLCCSVCVLIGCRPAALLRLEPASGATATLTLVREAASGSVTPTPSAEVSAPVVQGKDRTMADLQQCLVKHWVHSHEEDTSEVSVYRPVHYRFPPSRGRRGFDFHENGEVIYYGIGRADGVEQLSGRWVLEGANRIMLQVDSARIQPFVLEVVSCDDQTLKVKKS